METRSFFSLYCPMGKPAIYLNNEQSGKCFRIFSATEILAASINSSTIWFASLI